MNYLSLCLHCYYSHSEMFYCFDGLRFMVLIYVSIHEYSSSFLFSVCHTDTFDLNFKGIQA